MKLKSILREIVKKELEKNNEIIKLITKIILILLGIIMFSWFIWLRFLRTRFPKEIPMNLTFYGLCILIYICIIFGYLVYGLIKEDLEDKPFINNLIELLYKPVKTLDQSIKQHPKINKIHTKLIFWLTEKLFFYIVETEIFYYTLVIIPRSILVFTLFLDTFHFHYLNNIYKVLLLGIFLVFHRYFKYSFKYAKEYYLNRINPYTFVILYYKQGKQIKNTIWIAENKLEGFKENQALYDEEWAKEKCYVHFDDFLDYYTETVYDTSLHENKIDFIIYNLAGISKGPCLGKLIKESNEYQLCESKYNNLETNNIAIKLINLSLILKYYTETHNNNEVIKNIKLIIFTLYFLCWLYILIISIPNLTYFPTILTNMQYSIEPFSQLWI